MHLVQHCCIACLWCGCRGVVHKILVHLFLYTFLSIFPDSLFKHIRSQHVNVTSSKWRQKRRSSHRRCSVRKGILRNFAKFTGKHLCQSLCFNKVVGLRPATLLKKGSDRFCEISKITFFTKHLQATASEKKGGHPKEVWRHLIRPWPYE